MSSEMEINTRERVDRSLQFATAVLGALLCWSLPLPVDAQVVWGPTTTTTTPTQPDSGSAFQVNVSGHVVVGCAPLLLDSLDTQIIGSTIQVTAFMTCGVFTSPDQYALAVTVGPLPPANYTIEHFRRIRGAAGPYGNPMLAASVPLLVTAGAAIPAMSHIVLGLMAVTLLGIGILSNKRMRRRTLPLVGLIGGCGAAVRDPEPVSFPKADCLG